MEATKDFIWDSLSTKSQVLDILVALLREGSSSARLCENYDVAQPLLESLPDFGDSFNSFLHTNKPELAFDSIAPMFEAYGLPSKAAEWK